MKDLSRLRSLVKAFEECADYNDKIAAEGLEYARGKSSAFRYAAQWLREEIDLYEKTSR